MATYASLSAADKAVVDNTVNLIRAACGEVGKVFNHITAIAADTNAVNLVLSVDAAGVIPNTSGLAGADDMTRSELVAIFNNFTAMRDAYNGAAQRAAWSKAAGINAMLG